ncbi:MULTISPECIES: M10 family metallopeptidase C-terminal domain-containing protein [Pseudomonas]|uniref:M10 family metallopeptidase C-terminal domain-containing protein n=1 Tax=Pseudomonas TaxID=286 RepID=UPI00236219E1|nr:M10 family metallopeptidase C-terminal domain-containing protein [Pseudomonas asplenii]
MGTFLSIDDKPLYCQGHAVNQITPTCRVLTRLSDSTPAAGDWTMDFVSGEDRIDLADIAGSRCCLDKGKS